MIEYLLPPNRSLSNSASILVSLSKLKNHNSNPSLISQNSISLKSKNPKLKIFVWLQYLKTVYLFSVLNFFTFWWSPRPGSEGQLSLACDLFSPLSPKILFFLPISTHTPNVRTKSMIFSFSFSFSFSTLLPPYPQDPSPANTQSISAGEFLFLLCFMGYGGRDLLFFLCPERTPKSPNFG